MWVYNEDLLQFIWKKQLFSKSNLYDLQDRKVTVLNQGTQNKNAGPDFENARIKIDDVELVGSVEVHINGKDWYSHNHHKDKAYNNVVLHVCYTSKEEVKSLDGNAIPTINIKESIDPSVLARYKHLMDGEAFVPCQSQLSQIPDHIKTTWLERMGVERLEYKTAYAEKLLAKYKNDWNQLAYTLILRSFGMPLNTEVFEELAEKLPFQLLSKHNNSLFQLEALLLGCSNLIDQTDTSYAQALSKEFTFLKEKYSLSPVTQNFKKGRMRPAALPYVKLALFAAFLHQKPDLRLFYTSKNPLPFLEKVSASEFWNTHYSFNTESPFKPKTYSSVAIRHLVLNAIAPFLFLYGKKKDLSVSGIDIVQRFKVEENSIIKKWNEMGLKPKNAFDGQALLHLYKQYCNPKNCLACSIGQHILSKKNG